MRGVKRRSKSHSIRLAERRKSLIEAAISVIARKGIAGATLADIATEAECSYGLVSFHFKSKDGLLLAVMDFLAEEFVEARSQAIERAGPNPAARLDAVVALEFTRSLATANKVAIWTAFWAEASRNPAYRERCIDARQESVGEIEKLVQEIARLEPVPMEPEVIAHTISALIDGFLIQLQIGALNSRKQRALPLASCQAFLRSLFPMAFSAFDQSVGTRNPEPPSQKRRKLPAVVVPILRGSRNSSGSLTE